MTAQEMFEELGYKRRNDNKYADCWIDFVDERTIITFLLKSKQYCKIIKYNENELYELCPIEMSEHKAINKMCEELGWI